MGWNVARRIGEERSGRALLARDARTMRRSPGVHPDQVGAASRAAGAAAAGIFHEPSPNGELAPPPAAPLPGIPAMPRDFVPPAADEHLGPDAKRGAGELGPATDA